MNVLDVLKELFAVAAIVAVAAVAIAAAMSLIGRRVIVAVAIGVPLLGVVVVFAYFSGNFLESAGASFDNIVNHQVVEKHSK